MARRKLNVKTSWAAQYANEASNLQYLDNLNQINTDLQNEIQNSVDRTNQLQEDIARMYVERKAMQEDPEGYLYEKEQQELESKPKTLGNYLKNFWAKHGRDVNDFQIGDFQGYIDRANQWGVLAEDVKEFLDIEDRISDIDYEIGILKNSAQQNTKASQRIQDLSREKQNLISRHDQLKESVDAFKSYIPSSTNAAYHNLVEGDGSSFGFSNNALFGRTTQVHDELGDILRFTSTMFSPNRSNAERKIMLENAISEKDKKIKEWQKGIDLNIKDRESYAKVDRWFEKRASSPGLDIFDSDTWLYKMPGLLAGMTSGASKIVPSMLTGIATAAGIYATGGLGAVGIGATGGAATFGLNYGAGVGENNAEVAFAYNEKLENYLKQQKGKRGTLYDDIIAEGRKKLNVDKNVDDNTIFNLYRAGLFTINNAEANKKMLDLGIGIQNQFQDEMAATTWGAGVETALEITPINILGKMIKVPRIVRYTALKSAKSRAALRSIQNSNIAQTLAKGYEIGSTTGPIGGLAYAPLHLAVSPATRRLSKYGKDVLNKISTSAEIADRIPKSILEKHFMSDTGRKYFKEIGGRVALASATESIEEGKQNIASNRFQAGEYNTRKLKSIGETLVDDFFAGSKSAGLLLGMPFESLMSETDRRTLAEMKGGLILGGLQTGVVNVSSNIAPYRKEKRLSSAIINSVLIDKASKIEDLNNATAYAEASKSSEAYLYMLDRFKRIRELNNNEHDAYGEYAVDPEIIDEEEKRFKRIAKMANDPYTIKQAKSQGISVSSKDYLNFVATKALAEQELNDAKEVVQASHENLHDVSQQIQESILTQIIKDSGIVEENQEQNEDNRVIRDTSFDNYIRLHDVAKYAALLNRKQQIEVGILNALEGEHKSALKILNNQLKDINDQINIIKPKIEKYAENKEDVDINSLESVEKSLVLNKEDHENLSEAYRQALVAEQDYDLSFNQYEKVVGRMQLDGKDVDRNQKIDFENQFDNISFVGGDAKSVFKEIQETIDDDNDLASVIDEDFEKRTDEEGNEILTPEQADEVERQQEEVKINDLLNKQKEEKSNPQIQPVDEKKAVNKPVLAPSEPSLTSEPALTPSKPVAEQEKGKNKQEQPKNDTGKKTLTSYTKDGVKYTTVDTQGKVNPNSRFDLPEQYSINEQDLPDGFDGTILGVHELRESSDGRASATLVVKSVDGQIDHFDVRLVDKSSVDDSSANIKPTTLTQLHVLTSDQDNAIKALNELAKRSQELVKDVTPESYIINVNGQEIKMARVHSVMPEYWQNDGSFAPSLQVGNVVDNLARIFFGDKNNIIQYETNKESFIDTLINERASHKDNPNDPSLNNINKFTFKDLFRSREEFEKTINDMYNLFIQYQKLGWELSTEPIVWYSQFAKGWVAGETDMIAVDEKGKIHIIDFKTASQKENSISDPFGRYDTNFLYKLPNDLEEKLLQLSKSDFTVGPRGKGLSKKARSVVRDVRKLLKYNSVILVWDEETQQAKMRYINNDYGRSASTYRKSHIYNGVEKISKEDEYSDQLTAYMELIKKNMFDVVDMEVIGFRVNYDFDDSGNTKNLTSIKSVRNSRNGKPFRIKVFESAEMMHILNNDGTVEEVMEVKQDPIVENQQINEGIDSTIAQEQKKADKALPKNPEPDVTKPGENVQSQPITVTGHSNLNVNVINKWPELVKGAVFDKNFIDDLIVNGSVELYTEVVKGKPTLYANITYNDKTYERIYIYGEDTGLLAEVQRLESNKKEGQKIVATKMSRTAGKIESGTIIPVSQANLIDEKIEQLEFSISNKTFGFVKNGNVVAYNGTDTKTEIPMLQLTANTKNGTLIYLKKIYRSDSEGGVTIKPVEIQRKNLANDADFIVNCLKHIDVLNKPYIIEVGGKSVSIGVTEKQLLNMLIPYVEDVNNLPSVYSIVRHPNEPSLFYIINKNKQILSSVDIRDENSINKFKDSLKNFAIEEQPGILVSKLNTNNSVDVFRGIYKFFANNKDGIKSIQISDSLKFDFDDFANGLTGLGWYVKHGIFTTDYAGMSAPKISINGVGYVDSEQEKAIDKNIDTNNEPQVIDPQQGFSLDDINFTNWGGDLFKSKTATDVDKPLLTKETIKKHLRPILGDLVDDPSVVRIVETLANDPRVKDAKIVGTASSDAITLFNDAFEGVDYHEAFHRIFELFVPKDTRDSIYEKTAKRLGVDLSQSNEENGYIGHRQVAEWVADKYMDFRRYNVNTGIYWLDKAINYIIDIVRALLSINNRDLYKVFLDVNSGKYRNLRNASKENVERFDKMFGQLNYEIHGVEFNNIVNDPMYEECKNSMFYCIVTGQNIDVSGSTIQNVKIDRQSIMRGAEKLKRMGIDVFGNTVEPNERSAAQLAMVEMLVKFDVIADDLAAMMSSISTDYRKIMQEDGAEDFDGGESTSSYDENFFKWSYEFDKFDKVSSRVKFFFATIPDIGYSDDTHNKYKLNTNSIGLPQFTPMNYVFNEVLSNLWDVDTVEEVVSRLTDLAMVDPMYNIILNNLKKIIRRSYDADNEALLAQLMTTIRSNRHTFMLVKASQDTNYKGKYDIKLQRSDADYNARVFSQQWSQVLSKGGSETLKLSNTGAIIFNPKNPHAVYTFSKIANLFNQIQKVVSGVNKDEEGIEIPVYNPSEYEIESSIGNRTSFYDVPEEIIYDLTDPKQCDRVKQAIVEALNRIGINIHIEEFNFMLNHKYGSSDVDAIKQMMFSIDETDSIGSFMFFLNNIVKKGTLNISADGNFTNSDGKKIPFDNVYSSMAFVRELGNWKYEYRHAHDQLSVLATGGNRFYEISDNDYMSDVIRNLNKRGKWFNDLREDIYNYFIGEEDNFGNRNIYGSLALKLLSENPDLKLSLKHYIGFKTDKKGNEGADYFEISRREDYLSKATILENDGMISLTLSDKKKYVYLSGIKLPGIDYSPIFKSKNRYINTDLASLTIFEPDGITSNVYNIQQREDVVNQMISYAISEYQSILANAQKLNDGHKHVSNFDTKNQCVKFSSLLGVYETTYDKDGKPNGERYISFNDSSKSWLENLRTAEKHFFNKSFEEQLSLIGRVLTKLAEKELETATKLGLIQKIGDSENPFYNYQNTGLNNKIITSLKMSYLLANAGMTDSLAESLAVVAYLNDISTKAIISGQEMERLFSGNPAFYKWKYDSDGRLIDRTVDELKRLGGLGSTGVNNFTELKNIPEKYLENGVFSGKYRCAEVDNEMVASPQFEEMQQAMYEGQLRDLIISNNTVDIIENLRKQNEEAISNIRKNNDLQQYEKDELISQQNEYIESEIQKKRLEICNEIDNATIDDLELKYPNVAKEAKLKAKPVSDALKGDIDVADGGAYITDTMCEMLLRMEGAYSKDILEAFAILRGEVTADYLGLLEAYQKVLTKVIGNLKYTAFGRRLQNGVSVPYYHKTALFPVFECIATGKMSNIFDKMKEQGIDMLLVNSAVKVGSEGSKPIDWNRYREDDDIQNPNNFDENGADGLSWKPTFQENFNFDTYECEFDYLRKQLNTDPKEEAMLRMGTLMQKVIFSNINLGRTYTDQYGDPVVGKDLLTRIMNSSNALSDIGVDKINKKFFVTNEDGLLIDSEGKVITNRNSDKRVLDIEKFSKEVRKLMSDRGADKNIMNALELVKTAAGSRLTIPLGAISNSSWLESVLISSLNKDIVDVNTPGAFYIQRSIWSMLGHRMYDRNKGNIVGRQLYNGKSLQMKNEEGSMDCVISIDFFEHILPKVQSNEYELDENENYIYQKDKNGNYKTDQYGNYIPKRKMRDMTFDEARQWLLDQGIIGGKANIIAYRIPTQAESSIHALRCVDVLPVVRDTVILPEEFTKITGSDFDIDKLGLSTINWNIKGLKASDKFEDNSEQYYLNLLIRDYITLLIDKHTQHILHRSIDNDTKLLKDVLKEIESTSGKEETPYGFYSLSTLTERKNDYITGKIGIGPFALNNNNHILTMLYGVKFKDIDYSIMSTLGLNDLSTTKDYEGNSVLSWISALINAHVDIAKDPYIGRLNVNKFTYNLVNTLIRTGFGKKTFYFTTQPIIKELADAYNNASSSYMADPHKSMYQLQKDAIEQTAKNRFENVTINDWTYDEIIKGIMEPTNPGSRVVINDFIYQIVNSEKNVLAMNANKSFEDCNGCTVKLNDKNVDLTGELVQLLMYLAYMQFEPYALSVSNLVKYSKIDTKKHGKSYIEQQVYNKGFNDLFFNENGTGLFEERGLNEMANKSYIANKTINAITMTKAILKNQFLQSTNAFDDAIDRILALIGNPDSKSVDLYKSISQALTASIKSEFINEYASDISNGDKLYIHDLVSESEENLKYVQSAQSGRLKVVGDPRHDLKSYIGGKVNVEFTHEGNTWRFQYNVLGYDEETKELITDGIRKIDNSGKMKITGGKNTIYDRFLRLAIELRDNVLYSDVLDESGEPSNALLRSLVTGTTFEYRSPVQSGISYQHSEVHDTYSTLKFVKLFNALDQNGVESNRIIDGWDELLNDNKHPLLKKFAEDLVVYAFVTSGDLGGFNKFFKQVPLSWRIKSGYAEFIQNKIDQYSDGNISTEQLHDVILNNWFDNQLVPKYNMYDDDSKIPNFITYSGERRSTQYRAEIPFPVILAALRNDNGVLTPSIDPDKAPIFIKTDRNKNAGDSQRRVTVYQFTLVGMRQSSDGTWVRYPIYLKVEPKGNQLKGNYLITEYGREDSILKEYAPNEESLKKLYALGDFISSNTIKQYSVNWGNNFAQMVEDMNYRDLFVNTYKSNINEFDKAVRANSLIVLGEVTTDSDKYYTLDFKSVSNESRIIKRTIKNGYVLTEVQSRALDAYLKKSHGMMPKQFYISDNILIIKSNNYKNSWKYNIINTDTGEIIGENIRIYTHDQYVKIQEYRGTSSWNPEEYKYNEKRSFAFKKRFLEGGKSSFKRSAKEYIMDVMKSIENSEYGVNTFNVNLIDDFINKFSDEFWNNIITYHYTFEEETEGDSSAFGVTTYADNEWFGLMIGRLSNIPKQAIIDILTSKLDIKFKKKEFINRGLTRKRLLKNLKFLYISQHGHPSEEESIKLYCDSHNYTEDDVKHLNEILKDYDEYDGMYWAEFRQHVKHYTQFDALLKNIEEEYKSKFFEYIKNKLLNNQEPKIRIGFNKNTSDLFNAISSVFHEPYHALDLLTQGTNENINVLNALNDLLQTTKGKEFLEKYDELNGGRDYHFMREIPAVLFSLMMMPKDMRIEYIQNNLNMSSNLTELIVTFINLVEEISEYKHVRNEEYKETEKIDKVFIKQSLSFYEKFYNYVAKTIGDLIPFLRKFIPIIKEITEVEYSITEKNIIVNDQKIKDPKAISIDDYFTKQEFFNALEEVLTNILSLTNVYKPSNLEISYGNEDILYNKGFLNNTEENRKKAENYVIYHTSLIHKLKDKEIAAYRAIGEINSKLGTNFEVTINKLTLGVSVPSKEPFINTTNTSSANEHDIDNIYSLIYNEPSYDSAVSLLIQNGYDINSEDVQNALGKLIKRICKGG